MDARRISFVAGVVVFLGISAAVVGCGGSSGQPGSDARGDDAAVSDGGGGGNDVPGTTACTMTVTGGRQATVVFDQCTQAPYDDPLVGRTFSFQALSADAQLQLDAMFTDGSTPAAGTYRLGDLQNMQATLTYGDIYRASHIIGQNDMGDLTLTITSISDGRLHGPVDATLMNLTSPAGGAVVIHLTL